ncbi:hypothetical protein HQ496_10770 [bacterium]|nr:hypothetical protein [bacterium]
MKLHPKTIFVLLGTLAIGIAIGALWQSTLHNRRMEALAKMRGQGGLYSYVDRYIDPVDPAQEDTLRSLSELYQNKLGRFVRHYQWHRSTLMDSMKTDMYPLLTPDQIAQIDPWFERSIRRNGMSRSDSTSSQNGVAVADSVNQVAAQDSSASPASN